MDKNINFSISSKVIAATALGAGILVGASAAYVLTRIKEHSNLTHLISHLHSRISEVKKELSNLENELGYLHRIVPYPEVKPTKKRHKKAVSFSSSTSQSSYKTALQSPSDEISFHTSADTLSVNASPSNDSVHFSPVEDDDEFFDIPSSSDEDRDSLSLHLCNNTSKDVLDDVSGLTHVLRKVDSLIDGGPDDQIEACNILAEYTCEFEGNAEILWRRAKATRSLAAMAQVNGNRKKRIELINEAYEYASKALEINDNSPEVHKWFAILSGARGEFKGTRERIASGQVFKTHIDIALQISPNDSTLHHLLGRFCYELSLLSWVERTVASTLFADIPSSSFEEALNHFLCAEELKPTDWKENKFFVAKCYFQMADKAAGGEWLGKAFEVGVLTADDEVVNDEIQKLAQQYSVDL